jgi:ABC-2 type transport system ATP-binding protein/ribosome-dependent ATPase
MTLAGDVLFSARAIVRRFGPLLAVDRADLEVHAGEIVGLLGANGAGKTTLIRIVLGLLPADSGTARLFGLPPSRGTRRRLGYVSQGLGLWEDLSVAENLQFTSRAFGKAAPAVWDTADDDLAAASRSLVRDLPLGLRRRLAFAAALAHDPDLLVLDEPTSGVDPLARARLWDTVHAAVETGKGSLVTTHYMDEAGQCDRLVVMSEGRVVAAGTAAAIVGDRAAVTVQTDDWATAFALLDEAGVAAALVGRDLRVPGADPVRIQRLLDAAGVAARTSLALATFEEVFVALAGEPTTPPAPDTASEDGA